MFPLFQSYSLIFILFKQISLSFENYNHLQLTGNIFNLKTNLSVFIRNSSGILFYSFDSDYRFLIIIETVEKWQQISLIYKENKSQLTMQLRHYCERNIYGDVYLTFFIHLQQSEVIIGCDQTLSKLQFKDKGNSDYFNRFPIPINEKKDNIYIWMGNIGPYDGSGFKRHAALERQLLGCVDLLYFNNTSIYVIRKGLLLLLSCKIKYIEKAWSINSYIIKEISYKMYDCDITSLNARYCSNNIEFLQLPYNRSYIRTTFKESNFFLRLDWKNSQSLYKNSYCLMEIGLRDNSLILFYVNENNVLIESEMKTNSINYMETFLINIKSNTNNILLIHNDKLILTMKIYDGEIIHTYTHSIKSEIIFVNIGHFKHNNSIPWFMGNIKFQYNKSIWANSLYFNETITTPNLESIGGKLTLPSIILIILVIFIFAVVLKTILTVYFKNRNKSNIDGRNIERPSSKTPSPNHYEYDMIETNVDINTYTEIHPNEEIQEDNDTNNIYEKIK